MGSVCYLCNKFYPTKDIARTVLDAPICIHCYNKDPEKIDKIFKEDEKELDRVMAGK